MLEALIGLFRIPLVQVGVLICVVIPAIAATGIKAIARIIGWK